jgi:hypothetical protein
MKNGVPLSSFNARIKTDEPGRRARDPQPAGNGIRRTCWRRGDSDVICMLRETQQSKHTMLVHAIAGVAGEADPADPAIAAFRAGYELLTRVQETDPATWTWLIGLPHIGGWANDGLIRLGQGTPPDFAYLACAAASAAVRAGVPFELHVPVRDGHILLPGLGRIAASRETGGDEPAWIRLRYDGGQLAADAIAAPPPDSVTLAETLVHEFQHVKLSGLFDLVPLSEFGGDTVYAPWRCDPRPAAGLLQGVYAHIGIVRFRGTQWHAETDPDDALRAQVQFARWQPTIEAAVDTLRRTGCLTARGFLPSAENTLLAASDDCAGRLGIEAIIIARSRNDTAADQQDDLWRWPDNRVISPPASYRKVEG